MDQSERRPDIMSEILNASPESQEANAEDLDKIIYRDPKELQKVVHRAFRLSATSDQVMGDDLKKLVQPDATDDIGEHKSFQITNLRKKKTTIYFSKKIYLMLKSAKYKMKKMVEPEMQSKISMSSIINTALLIVLHEFDIKGENSVLLRQTVKRLKKK